MRSSAAVADLPQGSMCCAFRDFLLRSPVVVSGYFSSCSFPAAQVNSSSLVPLSLNIPYKPQRSADSQIVYLTPMTTSHPVTKVTPAICINLTSNPETPPSLKNNTIMM